MTRRRVLAHVDEGGGGIIPSDSMYADICLYNKANGKLIIVKGEDWSGAAYPESKFTPVGVVVVPGSHNVYGDGTCGVMSICEMNCNTPQQGGGTAYQGMYWGDTSVDISSLPNLNKVPYVGSNGTVNGSLQGQTEYAYLPSTSFSKVKNPYDEGTSYYYNDSDKYIPSPYITGGARNPLYYQTSAPSSAANALADFDGRGNTSKIIAQRGVKDYTTWKPTYNNMIDYPAASCCDMFSTVGTEQGDWYLPSCGEFGYIIVRLKEINEALNKLKAAYPNTPLVSLLTINYYWSSSEYSAYFARYLFTYNGFVNSNYIKGYNYYVRALLRVGA